MIDHEMTARCSIHLRNPIYREAAPFQREASLPLNIEPFVCANVDPTRKAAHGRLRIYGAVVVDVNIGNSAPSTASHPDALNTLG
jgi:hypothetical protein